MPEDYSQHSCFTLSFQKISHSCTIEVVFSYILPHFFPSVSQVLLLDNWDKYNGEARDFLSFSAHTSVLGKSCVLKLLLFLPLPQEKLMFSCTLGVRGSPDSSPVA